MKRKPLTVNDLIVGQVYRVNCYNARYYVKFETLMNDKSGIRGHFHSILANKEIGKMFFGAFAGEDFKIVHRVYKNNPFDKKQ